MDEERRGMEEVKNERTNSKLSKECLRRWITALNMPMPSRVAREITKQTANIALWNNREYHKTFGLLLIYSNATTS